jgi:hypothetical protein
LQFDISIDDFDKAAGNPSLPATDKITNKTDKTMEIKTQIIILFWINAYKIMIEMQNGIKDNCFS